MFRENFLSCSLRTSGAQRDLGWLKEPGGWESPVEHATAALMHIQKFVKPRVGLRLLCPVSCLVCHLGVNQSSLSFALPLPFAPVCSRSGLPSSRSMQSLPVTVALKPGWELSAMVAAESADPLVPGSVLPVGHATGCYFPASISIIFFMSIMAASLLSWRASRLFCSCAQLCNRRTDSRKGVD